MENIGPNIYRDGSSHYSPGAIGLAQWMHDGRFKGYSLYYLNFMFDQLPGPPDAAIQQMRTGIRKGFYSPLCTQCAHHPKAPAERHRLPELMLYLDLPVYKRKKKRI